jgi:leucine dehydrogenase
VKIVEKKISGYEQVLIGEDSAAGYRGIIAIHNTALGPAVGGTRFWNYLSDEDALNDALRLSRGMTYKSALAGLPFGGGKSVIIGDNKTKNRERIFRAHGRFIQSLGGRYITAEDVGSSAADMEFVLQETQHVAGLQSRSGDPSPFTARGVFRAMQASARYRWESDDLVNRTVALQGCGNVGYHLARALHEAGVKLIVSDVDSERVSRAVKEFDAKAVATEAIYGVEADIFAPCALGGIINDHTIPMLKVELVVGGANNQLLEARHGDALEQRGILYAPDYAANAGGIINGAIELAGWERRDAMKKIDSIYDTLLNIYSLATRERIPTYQAADRIVEERLSHASVS